MPVLNTLLVSIPTAAVTALVVGVFVSPWLDRRKRLLGYRQQLMERLIEILVTCGQLQSTQMEVSAPGFKVLKAEKDRWRSKVDDATEWLIDNVGTYGVTYTSIGGFQELLIRYVFAARGVWLSSRTMERKIEQLHEATDHVHFIFFAPAWRRIPHMVERKAALKELLDRIEKPASVTETPSA